MVNNFAVGRKRPSVSLDLIANFVVLCDEGAMGAAAERMEISRHTLARRLDRLEAEMGTKLLVRSTRRMQLTAAGSALLERARPITAELDDAVLEAKAVQRAQKAQQPGHLAIAVTTDVPADYESRIGSWLAARGIAGTVERRPEVRALDLLGDKRRDFVLLLGRSPLPRAEIVAYEPALAVFPADHPASSRSTIRIGDLADLPVAISDTRDEQQRRERVMRLHGDPDLPYVTAPAIGTTAQGLLQAARNQRAVTVVTESAISTMDTTDLSVRPLDPPLTVPITLVPREGLDDGTVRGLADFLLGSPG